MSILELIAVVFSLLCVWLSAEKNVMNWPAGIIGVTAYLFLFYRERLYADMILQTFFIGQGFYGWYNWSDAKKKEYRIIVEFLSWKKRIEFAIGILGITVIWAFLLHQYTDASIPYVDAFAATTSLFANWLMIRRKIEHWILWITADLVYIGLFWFKGLYLSSGIYFLFLMLAIIGLKKWIRKSETLVSH